VSFDYAMIGHRFCTERRRSFSVSRRQLQDDGMGVGRLIII